MVTKYLFRIGRNCPNSPNGRDSRDAVATTNNSSQFESFGNTRNKLLCFGIRSSYEMAPVERYERQGSRTGILKAPRSDRYAPA